MTTEERLADHEKRIVALEEDDAKVHGIIAWTNDKIVANPKVAAAIAAAAAALMAWFAHGAITPAPAPAPQPAATAPAATDKTTSVEKTNQPEAKAKP